VGYNYPLKEIIFQVTPIEEAKECNGLMIFSKDLIKIRAPYGLSLMQANGFANVISHEISHHLLQEHHSRHPDCNAFGNNLVHYATNDPHKRYQYQKRYWSPSFFVRYGLPYIKINYFDLPLLVRDRDVLMAEIQGYKAPTGKDQYWR
jgi:hypothetical protein